MGPGSCWEHFDAMDLSLGLAKRISGVYYPTSWDNSISELEGL